jgi:hypothetical protein
MTKYILNSGGIRNNAELKKKFHREIVKDLGKNPKFMLCDFAQGREYWEPKFPGYSASIKEDMPNGVSPSFMMAMPETFVEQCRAADVIYLHGGDDDLLQYWLKQFELPKIWEGKVVATNSASSHAMSKYFWTCDWRHCKDGLGILPIKFIAHYQSTFGTEDPRGPIDWDAAYKELEVYGEPGLSIHALKEGEYIVVEK